MQKKKVKQAEVSLQGKKRELMLAKKRFEQMQDKLNIEK